MGDGFRARGRPAFPLDEVRELVKAGRVRLTKNAESGARGLGCAFDDVQHVILELEPDDMYKSAPSVKEPGLFVDTYKMETTNGLGDLDLFIEIQVVGTSDGGRMVKILSFKQV